MTTFMAIDPGSYQTGVSVFSDGRLKSWFLLTGTGPIEYRIAQLVTGIDIVAAAWPDLSQVACEKLTALKGRTPPPELGALTRRLRQWARAGYRYCGPSDDPVKKLKFAWFEYHPATVVAAVRPRGISVKVHKEVMSMGIGLLYGGEFDNLEDVDQNVIDAIAVGHCHLSKMTEAELIAGRS